MWNGYIHITIGIFVLKTSLSLILLLIEQTILGIMKQTNTKLSQITRQADRILGFTGESISLAVVYYLIANRYWIIDMNNILHPGKKLDLLGVNIDRRRVANETL